MGLFASIDAYRRQGFGTTEAAFVTWAVNRAVDEFLLGAGDWATDYNTDARVALLRAPVSFAAVLDDLCRLLKVPVPCDVEQALAGEEVASPVA